MQLVVGRVGRPHGIRGEVTVQVHTDDPDLRFAAGSILVTEPAARGPLTVSASRWHSGRLLVTFAGYADRDQAEDLRGTLLHIDSSAVGPAADPEEFHDYQLIGLDVLTRAGKPVGVVTDVLHQGQDLLVIRPPEDGAAGEQGEVLVPFVGAIVPEVDVAAGRLVIDPPPGLLELGASG
ncbi:MAG TPA: ribosome maturation factor RimM [Streptosporangiaceae bacterium]|nr:ribosome maturation factor RimM [Streptosporangiaceae bacterium]